MEQLQELRTSLYKITQEVRPASRVSDYDYDPRDPGRRFVTTFFHTLVFRDPITNSEIVTLRFASETCASIVLALYKIITDIEDSSGTCGHLYLATIDKVFVNGSSEPSKMVISKNMYPCITMDIISSGEEINLKFNGEAEARAFSDFIETDELDGYRCDSEDRVYY